MPSTIFKEILVFAAGSTPQIVTESIQALSFQTPPVYADELHIVTTYFGQQRINETLLQGGILERMCADLSLPSISVHKIFFHIPLTDDGIQLADIRTDRENELFGDLITSLVRTLSSDPNSRLHCSIAGGRKTMSFYLGAALQLFGRYQDKLYHALISPEFEANPHFYYIPTTPTSIPGRVANGSSVTLNTADAIITLAELPFIRLGERINYKGASFSEMVAEGQRTIDTATLQPEVRVNLKDRTVIIGGLQLELVPTQLMLYAAILRQKSEYCKYPERDYCADCTACYLVIVELGTRQALEKMACDYAVIYGGNDKAVDLLEKWPHGFDIQALRQIISKLNRSLRDQLTDPLLIDCVSVECKRSYGSSRYGVRIEKGKVTIA